MKKNLLFVAIIIIVIAIGLYVNETTPNERGYDKTSFFKSNVDRHLGSDTSNIQL